MVLDSLSSDSIADESVAHSFSWAKTKRVLVSAAALWVTLLCWSVASPHLVTPDEHYHTGSIWCAAGVDNSTCFGIIDVSETTSTFVAGALEAQTPFVTGDCGSNDPTRSALCSGPKVRNSNTLGDSMGYNGSGLYPKQFYRTMHMFVGSNTTVSLMLMRSFNASIATLLFVAVALLGSKKQFLSWLTSYLFTISPLGFSLISSINPSGWAITGMATSWMFLIIAVTTSTAEKLRKILAAIMWLFSGLLCIASRYDAAMYWVATNIVVLAALFGPSLKKITKSALLKWKVLLSAAAISIFLITQLAKLPNMIRIAFVWRLPRQGEPSLTLWVSSWLVNIIALPIEAFGTAGLGIGAEIYFPHIVTIFGTALLGSAILFSFIKTSLVQLVTVLVSMLLVTVAAMHLANHEYHLFNASGRYILPLVPFTVGMCIFLSKSPIQMMEIRQLRNWAIGLMAVAHLLSIYTVVERYVMGTSYGIQILKVGEDGWWWSRMPIGPNFLILLGSLSFLKFIVSAWKEIPTVEIFNQPLSKTL